MNSYTTAASVIAAMALSLPLVCQAQDPLSSLTQVKALSKAGKVQEAVTLCDKVLKRFSNPKSATARQFAYVLPFYAWEKANCYFQAKDYENAYNAFKAFTEDKRWQDPSLQALVKAKMPAQPEGYTPFLTYGIFQMGNCRYKQGIGDDKVKGDPTKFADAITCLEKYLGLLQRNKVSATERKQKMDGSVCFLLLQAYLLKPEPDFAKAAEYLEKSRASRGRVPDSMAMDGLNTIVNVALSNPDNVAWVYKLIEASPASYNLDPARAGRNANKFLNLANKAYKLVDTALGENNTSLAADAARSSAALFGLVADTASVRSMLSAQVKALGKYNRPVPDRGAGVVLNAPQARKLLQSYNQIATDNMELDGFAVLGNTTMAHTMGSNRLAKGGFQVVFDRYGQISRKDDAGELQPMRNTIIFQLAQLSYATGDEAAGVKYDGMLEGEDMGEQNKTLAFNKMNRLLKAENWAEVIPAAKEVMEAFKDDTKNKFYVSAQYTIVAAYYKMGAIQELIQSATELLEGGNLAPGSGKDRLTPAQVTTYKSMTFYFLMDTYTRAAKEDPTMRDKALAVFDIYAKEFTSTDMKENPLGPNMYFSALANLMNRASHSQDEAAAAADNAKALEYCKHICANWTDHELYPSAELMAASIVLNGKDDAAKPAAIDSLERCTDAALKLRDGKGLATAANALFWLYSYSLDLERAGENEDARKARVKTYIERFWKEADYEGNAYALQASALQLLRAESKEEYDAAIKRNQEVIAREATYAFKHNTTNPDLEKTINTYVDGYVTGSEKHLGKKLTLEEKAQHFNNFAGIDPADKYTNAIFRMALISSMNQELVALKDDKAAQDKLNNDIERTFREMTNTFKPADLTNFICVQVGDYLVNYVGKFAEPSSKTEEIATAVTYYDAVLERKQDMVAEATLGKANALAFSADAGQQQQAVALYGQVTGNADPLISGPALQGLTKLHMRSGNPNEAIKTARAFLANRANTRGRMEMNLMLGQAYTESGDTKNALLGYMNLFNQNKGAVLYSAQACQRIMEILWKRNTPSTGDRIKGDFKASDRWNAWSTGQVYVNQIRKAGIEKKLTPAERDEFNKVINAVKKYAADPAVQAEDKANKAFKSRLQK